VADPVIEARVCWSWLTRSTSRQRTSRPGNVPLAASGTSRSRGHARTIPASWQPTASASRHIGVTGGRDPQDRGGDPQEPSRGSSRAV